MLTTYHEVAVHILDTLETRLIKSLQVSTPRPAPPATLASLLHRLDLTPDTLTAALPGSDVSAVWWRLYGRWCEVRDLDVLLLAMMTGEAAGSDAERMDEVERRMRALGFEVPAAEDSSSSSWVNDARGAAA